MRVLGNARVGALAGGVLLLTSPAAARIGERYDLASLILDSHAVILAERGPKRPLGSWAAATRFKVKKVYRGRLLPGQEIEVFDDLLVDPEQGLPVDSFGQERMAFDADAVLILLAFHPPSFGAWVPADAPTIRIFKEYLLSGGRVYTFVEYLHAQGRDPEDARGSALDGPLSLPEFEVELMEAIARVEAFRRAMSLKDPVARKEALLAVIQPQEDLPEGGWEPLSRQGYADRLRQGALEMFSKEGDLDSALEVAARSSEGLGFHFYCPLGNSHLLAAAQREDVPPHRRAAALCLLARHPQGMGEEVVPELVRLLDCKDLELRQAAAHLACRWLRIDGDNPGKYEKDPLLNALCAAWRQEPDPAFRIAILRAAGGGFTRVLSKEERKPLFTGCIRPGRARYVFASMGRAYMCPESLVVVATRRDANAEHRSRAMDSSG